MTTDYLQMNPDFPGALRRLNQPPENPQLAVSVSPSRTRSALLEAAEAWRQRCQQAGAAVTDHLGQLERFADQLVAMDGYTASDLAGLR